LTQINALSDAIILFFVQVPQLGEQPPALLTRPSLRSVQMGWRRLSWCGLAGLRTKKVLWSVLCAPQSPIIFPQLGDGQPTGGERPTFWAAIGHGMSEAAKAVEPRDRLR
jgi:hypothetical protein